MDKALVNDIIEWDIENWSKALDFWDGRLPANGGKGLELGARRGGLSLWMAKKGMEVVCSDYEGEWDDAQRLHKKYGVDNRITYQHINALDIPYENHFDVIMFKSILGGVARGGNDQFREATFRSIYRALKPGGILLFAENLEASALHRFLRKRFVRWGNDWNYLKYDDVSGLLSDFKKVELKTIGFFAAFGRSEGQRRGLALLDQLCSAFFSPSKKYILVVSAFKGLSKD